MHPSRLLPAASDALASSPDGRLTAAAYPNYRLLVWDNDNDTRLFDLTNLPGRISHLDFSPDGKLLAGDVGQGGLRVWAATDGTLAASLETENPVLHLEFPRTGNG